MKLTLLLPTCLTALSLQADSQPKVELPALPKRVQTLEELTSPDWIILAQATGELTKDEKEDAVIILTPNPANAPEDFEELSLRAVLAGDTEGYRITATSHGAVLCPSLTA